MAPLEDLQRRQILAAFLKSRRARLDPQDFGFARGARRRTPGLRREELAALANVGLAWYTAMEQAKDVHPSQPILSSLGRVLGLNPEETRHLFRLAGQLQPEEEGPGPGTLTPALQTILDALAPHPAYLLDHLWTYLGWNAPAAEVFGLPDAPAFGKPNLVWELFANPAKRTLYPDWTEVTSHVVAEFRADVEPRSSLPEVRSLVDRLRTLPEFARLWDAYPILGTVDRRKVLSPPSRDQTVLEYTTFRLAAQDGLRLIVYTPV